MFAIGQGVGHDSCRHLASHCIETNIIISVTVIVVIYYKPTISGKRGLLFGKNPFMRYTSRKGLIYIKKCICLPISS